MFGKHGRWPSIVCTLLTEHLAIGSCQRVNLLVNFVGNAEVCAQTSFQERVNGVRQMSEVLAVRLHDYPGWRVRLADVTQYAEAVLETSPDVAAVVVLQDDVQRTAQVRHGVARHAPLRRDWLELCASAHVMQSTHHLRAHLADVDVRCRHHPVADGREYGTRRETWW